MGFTAERCGTCSGGTFAAGEQFWVSGKGNEGSG